VFSFGYAGLQQLVDVEEVLKRDRQYISCQYWLVDRYISALRLVLQEPELKVI
jgi:hypothetical protein